jgi:hypothetical protein
MILKPYIIFGISTIFLGAIGLYIYLRNKKNEPFVNRVERYQNIHKFLIYNYFPTHSVIIDVLSPNQEGSDDQYTKTRLISGLKPNESVGISKQQVIEHFKGGNILRISVITPTGEHKLYTDYLIDTEKEERVKSLHIGMITTRYIGSTDTLRMSTVNGNAVLGNATVKIHNLSYIPIQLNDDIDIIPHSSDRYLGYLHQGVTLGTIFSDPSGLYPDYQYLKPYTDIYYGVVSDLRQPLDGCWQLEFNDDCEYGQSMWPFQDGTM